MKRDQNLHYSEPVIEAAWKSEIASRIDEIRSGSVQGIPGDEVLKRVRRIVERPREKQA